MTWEPELEELRRREAFAEALGGPEKVERQHHYGKLTIRERIAAVADDGSFHEIGKTAGVAEYDDDGNLVHLKQGKDVRQETRVPTESVVEQERPVTKTGAVAAVKSTSSQA